MMSFAILMVILILLGAPLFAIIAAGAFWNFYHAEIDLQAIAIEFYGIAEMPILLAIPLFTFAGYLLSESDAPKPPQAPPASSQAGRWSGAPGVSAHRFRSAGNRQT